jgi:hypothetical protein
LLNAGNIPSGDGEAKAESSEDFQKSSPKKENGRSDLLLKLTSA